MKRVHVKTLSGGEILSKDLYDLNYGNILMPKGTILKKDYIDKLPMLGVDTVFIDGEENSSNISRIMEMCQNQIKQVLEKHIYKHNEELKILCRMAEDMIMEAVTEEPLNEKVVEIQEAGGDFYSHSMQVCTLSTILAIKCGLDKETIQDILKGALLHDIGLRYITVPYENISIEKLYKSEREEYRRHTLEGYRALEQETWISSCAKDIIFYHHERLNGGGYPLKLRGGRLSTAVKIVSICDAFDERITGIGHERCHLQEALEYLRDNKGILFDRKLTESFLKMVVQYPTGCIVRVSTGEIGRVVYQNKEMPERPVVLLLQAEDGTGYVEGKELDLMKVLNMFIVEILEEKEK